MEFQSIKGAQILFLATDYPSTDRFSAVRQTLINYIQQTQMKCLPRVLFHPMHGCYDIFLYKTRYCKFNLTHNTCNMPEIQGATQIWSSIYSARLTSIAGTILKLLPYINLQVKVAHILTYYTCPYYTCPYSYILTYYTS